MKNGKNIFTKNFVINELFIKESMSQKLNLNEFLVLVFFLNCDDDKLDVQRLSEHLYINEENVLNTINSLMSKKLISLKSNKDENGKISDIVDLNGLLEIMQFKAESKSNANKDDIYSKFEKEFGRTLSSMEFELINELIESGYSKDMVLLALKEAVYNGVTNIRYIDKVLFEWKKKGFKTTADVEKYLKSNSKGKNSTKELYDYDWVNSEDENK